MLILKVNGKEYSAIRSWSEMTLAKAIEVHRVISDIPPSLRSIYAVQTIADAEERKKKLDEVYAGLTPDDHIKTFPQFYGKVLGVLTNIPAEVIEQILWESRTVFYNEYCLTFVYGFLHWPVDYVPHQIDSFNFKGVEYFLPEGKTVMGIKRPMANVEMIEFAECADLESRAQSLAGGKFEVAANIISILCRPKVERDGQMVIERYDEDTCLKRAELFAELPMDIVWEVFFCSVELCNLSRTSILISTMEGALKQQRQKMRAVSQTSDGTVR